MNDVDYIIVWSYCHEKLKKYGKVLKTDKVNKFLLKQNIYQEL